MVKLTDSVAPVLLVCGGGDGVAVVTTEENDWTLQRGGEIEASVGVSFTGSSLAEVTDHHTITVLSLYSVRCSRRYTDTHGDTQHVVCFIQFYFM